MGRSLSDSTTDNEMEVSASNKRCRDSTSNNESHKKTNYNTENDTDNTQYRLKNAPKRPNNYQFTVALDKIPAKLLNTQQINKSLSNPLVSKHILRAKITHNRKTLLLLAKNQQSFNYLNNQAIWRDPKLFNGTAEPRLPVNNTNIAFIYGAADEYENLLGILQQQFEGVTHITQLKNSQGQAINIIAVHFRTQIHLALAIIKRTFQLHFVLHQICPATSTYFCRQCFTYDHKTSNCTLKQPAAPVNKTCLTCKPMTTEQCP